MTREPVQGEKAPVRAPVPAEVASVLGHSVLPTGIVTRDGRFAWVNDAICRLFDRDRDELLASTWTDITYPADIQTDAHQVENLLAGTSNSYRLRKRYLRPDGSIRWGDLTVTAIRDRDGQTVELLGQVVDITNEVTVERAYEGSIRRLGLALDAQIAPELILQAQRDDSGQLTDLRIVEANQAAVDRLQRTREQLLGNGLLQTLGQAPDPALWSRLQHVVDTGETLELPLFRTLSLVASEDRMLELRAMKVDDGLALAWRDITELYQRTDEELRKSNEQYRLVLENSADVTFHTIDGIVQWIAPASSTVLGWSPEDLIGRPTVDYWHPDDRQTAIGLRDAAYAGSAGKGTLRWRRSDGSYTWVQVSLRSVTEPDGRTGAVGMLRDVSEQVQAQQDLAISEQRYRLLAENIADVVGTGTPDGRIAWVSDSIRTVLGWVPAELAGRAFLDIVHPADRPTVTDAQQDMRTGKPAAFDVRLATAGGDYRWMRIRARPTSDSAGTATGIVAGWQDINDRVEAMNRLDHVLGTDSLTGLPNRATMVRKIDALHTQAEAHGCTGALLCVGIDRLGDVNSAIDHAAGDLVLTTLARRIAEAVPDPQLVGRGAGVDFLVLLPNLTSVADSVAIAERIRMAVRQEVVVDHRRVRVTASIGIASCRADARADDLVSSATRAMDAAKDQGRDRLAFEDPSLRDQADRLLTLAQHARDGVANEAFHAWYMPIVDLQTQEPVGYEALVRWAYHDGTVLEPKEFLSALIESRMITEVDQLVLRQALGRMADLPEPVFMSINVSPMTLATPGYADEVMAAVHEIGVDPARVHLEVTETSLFGVSATNVATMQRLADAGIKWYVDDFGTGYSSISHLHDLPIGGLKLDTSFAQGLIDGNRRSLRITQALAGLSMGLGLDTVAEGVSDRAQAAILWGQGWRRGQGWLFGKAEPPGPGAESGKGVADGQGDA